MSKINVKSKLYNNEEIKFDCLIKGIKNNGKLIFKEENVMVNLEILIDEIIIQRKHEDYTLKIDFKESLTTPIIYDIKGIGNTTLNIKTNKLEINDNNIYIEYEIIESNEIYYYEINYEVV